MPKGSRTCEIAGCGRPHHARGLCNVCYVRAHRKRNPEYRERERLAERARKRPPRVEYWREYRRRAEVRERERRRHRDAWSCAETTLNIWSGAARGIADAIGARAGTATSVTGERSCCASGSLARSAGVRWIASLPTWTT